MSTELKKEFFLSNWESSSDLFNFYRQMADPSLDSLEVTISCLLDLPHDRIRRLQVRSWDIKADFEQLIADQALESADTEEIRVGLKHALEIVTTIEHIHYLGGMSLYTEKPDPNKLAREYYDNIQVRIDERRIAELVTQVQSEPNLRERARLATALRHKLLEHVNKFSFSFRSKIESVLVEQSWENLVSHLVDVELISGDYVYSSFGIQRAARIAEAGIRRYQLELRLEQLPAIDQKIFDELREQFGAKAANLVMANDLVESIKEYMGGDVLELMFCVPDFRLVPVYVFQNWKEGKDIDEQLRLIFNWANNLTKRRGLSSDNMVSADYIVRSSAVCSEDGKKVTGAGIYESVVVHAGSTFEDFKQAAIKVYKSVKSQKAKDYRAENGISTEEMGLIVQKYVAEDIEKNDSCERPRKGYANSVTPGVPNLMEIVTGTSRNYTRRDENDFFFGLRYSLNPIFRDIFHFLPDRNKVDPFLLVRVSRISAILERVWGGPVQIEFAQDKYLGLSIVQVRQLPEDSFCQACEVKFPDKPVLFSGTGVGVGDFQLSVLDKASDNRCKKGLVIFETNFMFSSEGDIRSLPQKGAVVICSANALEEDGHIQTLCAEKGLLCLFPRDPESGLDNLNFQKLAPLKRARIVSNGIEARLYAL
ncbi:MAG: PEP/pyruvate-binding domain-containing protein [Candidatus Shapirobacteria bacterium]